MPLGDLLRLVWETLRTERLRSLLTMLGIVIGMAAMVLLSSVGEGTRQGILSEFSQFGSTIIQINPGKSETFGMSPGVMGGTTHPITIEDSEALRRVPGVRYVAPHVIGTGEVETWERARHTYIYGTVWDDQHILQWYPRIGSFLPPGDPESIPAVCVLGATVAEDLFPNDNPLGEQVRIAEVRYRVVGVMGPKGQMIGFDLDDMVYIPVHRAMRMFNREGVMEVHLLATSHQMIDPVIAGSTRVLRDRHDGEEDFTMTTQADMLEVVNEVMDFMTIGVLVIAAISVLVGAMGILTIMWVAVTERTPEIGLMKALGASDRQVLMVFLAEAGTLSLLGGIIGTLLGVGGGWLLRTTLGVWVATPLWTIPMALVVSLSVGVLAGVAPALRAAQLDPVEALRAE